MNFRRPRGRHSPVPGPDDRELVTFRFEGRQIRARRGQSLAAALLADGVDVLTRSFKSRRPRGYTCGFGACPNCPLTVDGLPGVPGCTTAVRGGEDVRRERGWPSTSLDFWRISDVFARFLGAGFQFRHLAHHPRLAHRFERLMAHVAGAGRLPTPAAAADAASRPVLAVQPGGLVVVGGGVSGCEAALAAAAQGVPVILVERHQHGGRSRVRTYVTGAPGDAASPAERAAQLSHAVSTHPGIRVVTGTALGWYEDGVLPVASDAGLLELRPEALIVATGSYDVPLLFHGNDRPGVMLADAASRLAVLERVRPGRRAVVLTDGGRGYQIAAQLADAGVQVVAVADSRLRVPADDTAVLAAGDGQRPRLLAGATAVRAHGWMRARALTLREPGGASHRIRCDLICVAVTERPADELLLQLQYADVAVASAANADEADDRHPGAPRSWVWVVGSATGAPVDAAHARAAGLAAAEALSPTPVEGPGHVTSQRRDYRPLKPGSGNGRNG